MKNRMLVVCVLITASLRADEKPFKQYAVAKLGDIVHTVQDIRENREQEVFSAATRLFPHLTEHAHRAHRPIQEVVAVPVKAALFNSFFREIRKVRSPILEGNFDEVTMPEQMAALTLHHLNNIVHRSPHRSKQIVHACIDHYDLINPYLIGHILISIGYKNIVLHVTGPHIRLEQIDELKKVLSTLMQKDDQRLLIIHHADKKALAQAVQKRFIAQATSISFVQRTRGGTLQYTAEELAEQPAAKEKINEITLEVDSSNAITLQFPYKQKPFYDVQGKSDALSALADDLDATLVNLMMPNKSTSFIKRVKDKCNKAAHRVLSYFGLNKKAGIRHTVIVDAIASVAKRNEAQATFTFNEQQRQQEELADLLATTATEKSVVSGFINDQPVRLIR